MKKTLAILLALAMVFSTLTVAFAEGSIGADAQACVTLNMLQGEGNGVTADYLAKTPTRLQAAIMVLRLKGLEAAALAYTGTDNFADADQVAWAGGKAIMGYLKTHPELGWVGDQGKFNPNGTMIAKDYYKVMLETLGYKQNTTEVIGDFTYPGVIEFAATKGLAKVATVTNFTNNDVAIATIEALKANVKGAEKTLATSLVESKILDATIAQNAGVYNPAPVALAVNSVTAINGKQVVVTFTSAVDEDTITAENILVYRGTNTTEDAWTYNLSADGKTLVLGLTSAVMAQDSSVKVVVENVKSADGAQTVAKTENVVTMRDTTSPSVISAEFTSSKTIKIKVSEPLALETGASSLHVMNNVLVDGLKLVGSISQDYAKNELLVTLGAKLSAAEHKVKVTGYRDYSNWLAPDAEYTAAVVSDKTAPEISKVEAGRTSVKVTFNEPIQTLGTLTINGVNYTSGTTTDNLTFKIALTAGKELGLASLVTDSITYYGTTDMEGNTISSSAKKTFVFTAVDDTTAPTATIELDSSNNVIITFSEEMSNAGKVTVKKADGTVVAKDVVPAVKDATKYQYKVTATAAKLNAVATAANYTIVLTDAKDNSVRVNEIADTTITVAVADITAPVVLNAVLTQAQTTKVVDSVTKEDKPAQVTVYFSEIMDKATIENINNYTVSIAGGTTPINLAAVTGVTLEAASDAKSVVITFPGTGTNGTTPGATTNTDIYVLLVKDLAGNTLATTDPGAEFVFNEKVDVAGTATALSLASAGTSYGTDKVAMVAPNQIKVGFSNPMLVIDPSDFVLYTTGNSTTVKAVGVAYTLSSDAKVATITLNTDLTNDGKIDSADGATADFYLKAGNTKDIFGNKIDVTTGAKIDGSATNNASAVVAVADYVAPTLTKVEAGTVANTVKFTFSEPITEASAGDFINGLLVKDTDGVVLGMGSTVVSTTETFGSPADEIVVTLDSTNVINAINTNGDGEYTVKISFPAALGIQDASGNGLDAIADTDVTVDVDTTAPVATVTTTSATALVLTFNEALYNNGTAIADNADVKALFGYNGTAGNYTSATYDADTHTVTFVIAGEDAKALTIAGTVTDAAGNAVAGGSYDVVTYATAGTAWTLN